MMVKCDKEGIEKTSKIISEGGVIVFPTDTVYGIGCDPYNKNSVDKIYKIKKRPKEKPFPILAYSMDIVNQIVEFDEDSKKIAEKFWPGPLTLILKLKDEKLKASLEVTEKIAVRVPDNQCLLDILKNCKFLIGTSANYSGENSFTKSKECSEKIKECDIFVDGGDIQSKGESTIAEIKQGEVVIHREGALKKEEIRRFF
ncbi:MAG: L-threonylcarbamoyladenylate synthase [Nitrosopumilaceae archaeon]|uniref:Threonylcarbamoyl-AMP synthase n=1 Tax=Candidatus Nitrosomaritimum aestuariumsis TaxID=3342354 RepID=A0AC60W5G1_9ARCH|nr:threonylcarbamoyl-AMP synthase [Nitrosopumilaceae archaeon]